MDQPRHEDGGLTLMRHALLFLLLLVVPLSAGQAQRVEQGGMKSFSARDGMFSAVLLILDDKAMKEFEKPSTQGLHLTAMKTAKRGENVNLVIGFMGIELNNNLEADVTFDFKMIGPDGKQVGDDSKDIPAIKDKIDNPLMVFHSLSEVRFIFDETDKNGVYKVAAVVRDNVGKKTIPLEGSIELVD